jgi:hypothetical protein
MVTVLDCNSETFLTNKSTFQPKSTNIALTATYQVFSTFPFQAMIGCFTWLFLLR